jgi:asparagine synthase (glutamine-hydrolysing)
MCGVLAALVPGAVDPARLEAGLEALAHRGPDGRGLWISTDRAVALGHTRLAVIDVDGGAQPIASENGDVVAVVSGEIYDHERLRASLEARGHRFAGASDSEIVVHLYEELGLDFASELRGELAAILWDRRHRRLVAVRDRFGIKPLVFTHRGGALLIASEARALFALGAPAAWDRKSLLHAACHQYLPPSRTLFSGISALPAGHMLVAAGGEARIQRYWDLEAAPDGAPPRPEEIAAALDEAVRLRLRADVPIAFHLSGGLDSAVVAAIAAGHIDRRIDAFCLAFDDPDLDESAAAAAVTNHLGARLHRVAVSSDELLEALEPAAVAGETFAINGQLPAKLLLNRAVKGAGFDVALGGEGADEAFLGYAHLRADAGVATTGSPAERGLMIPEAGAALDLPVATAWLGATPGFLAAKVGFGRRLMALLSSAVSEGAREGEILEALLAETLAERGVARWPAPLPSAYLWTKLALAGYILRAIGDGAEMASAVEGRLPFLDHRFFAVARRVPIAEAIGGPIEKGPLRRALGDRLPPSTAARPKRPLLAPPLVGAPGLRDRLAAAAECLLWRREAIEELATRIADLPPPARRALDPVVCTVLSAAAIERTLRISDHH